MRFFLVLLLAVFCLLQHQAFAEAWPDHKIGSGFGVAVKPERTGYRQLEKIKATGFNYVRFDLWWDQVEADRGSYNWQKFDRFMYDVRKAGLKADIILQGSNKLYSPRVSVPPEKAFGASFLYAAPSTPEAMEAFVAFAVAAVKHYGTDDIIWEFWNEPDGLAFWPPKADPVKFSVLAEKTCTALRDVAPEAKIIGPSTARLPSRGDVLHKQFFEAFIKTPAKNCLDAISVHPYRHERAPETVIEDIKGKVRPFIAAYTDKKHTPLPVVVTEFGYSMADVSEEQQAAFALRLHLADLLADVPLTILYEWQDSAGMSEDLEQHFGMVDFHMEDKAGSTLLQRILPTIKDAVIVKRFPTSEPDCFALLIQQPNGDYQILAWMGLMKMKNKWTLQVQDVDSEQPTSVFLSLEPQLITINSPGAKVAVIKG